MKPLLPVYCRLVGYLVIALGLLLPFVMILAGRVTDQNLLFHRECSKLLMMIGSLMIIFAYHKNESTETLAVRNKAVRNAMFITALIFFFNMLLRVATHDVQSVDSSTFLVFLIVNVVCLEFGLKKVTVDRMFKQK